MSETTLAIGWQAITLAEGDGRILLLELLDPTAENGVQVTLERAKRTARENPNLIYATIRAEARFIGAPGFDVGGEG